MNRFSIFAVLLIFLSVSFVLAQESELMVVQNEPLIMTQDASVIVAEPLEVYPNNLLITLNSPVNGAVFETTSTFNTQFSFTVFTQDYASLDFALSDRIFTKYDSDAIKVSKTGKIKCRVLIEGPSDFEVSAPLTSDGAGSASKELSPGTYSWTVKCLNSIGGSFSSETRQFTINEIIVNQNNGNGGNSGGSSNRRNSDDDDDSGKRRTQNTLPLEELSTENLASDEQKSSGGITGAIIGALGKRSVWGIIGLFVLVALIGAFVYNKRKTASVKKD